MKQTLLFKCALILFSIAASSIQCALSNNEREKTIAQRAALNNLMFTLSLNSSKENKKQLKKIYHRKKKPQVTPPKHYSHVLRKTKTHNSK